ncbi:purine-nucleoside phosphorylase [Aliibacillus thermotolerans]|uniref:Purine nucleoside phosphorylase n=1 Tax=Aliibacillus thermotolerans TaxID=1834418 RepID=A0ABW0U899_9BACI|nr:purine-nucleoside phosphorylase [Aliibacillus thermotolerans]MDA3128617.1 purine-nucleoside phosphorylase [Aliibacillus thermotolerans]
MPVTEEMLHMVRRYIHEKPTIGLILGSGLGEFAEQMENKRTVPYEEIPHFPVSTVSGHSGQLICGEVEGATILAMQGRFHYYEGYSMEEVILPVRLMKKLGVRTLIVTNAAGIVAKSFSPGDLMLMTDHLNFMGNNPLIGPNDDRIGPRFPDLSSAYSPILQQLAREAAKDVAIPLKEGVYAGVTGPSYETPAEIRMLRSLGAHAVGMSTVPEVIAAVHQGMDVLGISCLTNMAAGLTDEPLDHEQVITTAERVKIDFMKLMKKIVFLMNQKGEV